MYAAVFLLAPFFAVRRKWRALPAKGTSAVYFAALGLGFMFFEITMIQRLVQFLGYPTYSLTVTLAAILLSTGVGALPEAVHNGENGMVIAPDDGNALGDAILRLQAEPALRARMAEVSYQLAQERFDARKSARRLLALLKEVAEQ